MKILNELTKYNAYKYLRFAFYIAIAGIVFACMFVGDAVSGMKEPVNIAELTTDSCKAGTRVKGDVTETLGYYWESIDKVNGSKRRYSEKRVYLIPFGNEGKYIGINVGHSDFEIFEALTDATYEGNANQISAEALKNRDGYIKKCDARMLDGLEEIYEQMGGAGEVSDVLVPYYIEQRSSFGTVMFSIGMGIIVLALVLLVVFFVNMKKEKEMLGNEVYIGQVVFDRDKFMAKQAESE